MIVSDLSTIIRAHFAGLRFRSTDLQYAGRLLKKGDAAVVEYLTGKGAAVIPDFRPPAKCNIIAQSRPFEEWPICKASIAIQSYIYGLTKAERETCTALTSSASQKEWLASTGVDTAGYTTVQGLGLIFAHALARYDGVVVKVENKNKKALACATKINTVRAENGEEPIPTQAEHQAFGEDGKLTNPPGINTNIYFYQQASPVPWSPKHVDIVVPHVSTPQSAVTSFGNRLSIPKGAPGYVPEWQRDKLSANKHKRMRAWYSTSNRKAKPGRRTVGVPDGVGMAGAIPLVSRVGADWIVFDGRGLLRNLRWRGLIDGEPTTEEILGFFTGDPVIDVKYGVATFIYKQAHATVKSRKVVVGAKRAQSALMELTKSIDDRVTQVGLVSIDLGQTNPVAYEVSRVRQDGGALHAEQVGRGFLPDVLVTDVNRYRTAFDVANERIRRDAIGSLSIDQQSEIDTVEDGAASHTKLAVRDLMGCDLELPWTKMSSGTTYISEALVTIGKSDVAMFRGEYRRDGGWARHLRTRLTSETRTALNEALWEMQQASSDYRRLSARKLELARCCVNHVLRVARKLTQCTNVAVVVEDLNVRMFHGSGKRDVGWDEFFVPKRENRWFMQVLHKAFTDLAQHRGMVVAEVNPARTSITCPACGHCDKGNRNHKDRERFECLGCGCVYNADLEVATANIRQIAISGTNMPNQLPKPLASGQVARKYRGRSQFA